MQTTLSPPSPKLCKFWLGTHKPAWVTKTLVPLFLSHRVLRSIKQLPRAMGEWALDSGGFTELNLYGRWQTTPAEYVAAVRRYRDDIGNLAFAAIQDWMCEPFVLAKTGLTVEQHQVNTVNSYLELRATDPTLPWLPVLQGWTAADYLRHVDLYAKAGVDLRALPLIGLGSVCRRQNTAMAEELIVSLEGSGIRIHGFGFKYLGLRKVFHVLTSADSMAWSVSARRRMPLPGHTHKNCANCYEYAMLWRHNVMTSLTTGVKRPINPTGPYCKSPT